MTRKEFYDEEVNKGLIKALYMIDMNNGFVNFGPMANPEYNKLVPEQLKMLEKFKKEDQAINFILEAHDPNATEFKTYPIHCVRGTAEAEVIPEFKEYFLQQNAGKYYKNCINGMFNTKLQDDIKRLKAIKEVVIEGVCADLCVMDFARNYARFLDEINREAKIFVVRNAIDTFDAPGHNRDEWLYIAEKVMIQAGIEYVDNIEQLEERERQLQLTL